jgi:hypothetical protein
VGRAFPRNTQNPEATEKKEEYEICHLTCEAWVLDQSIKIPTSNPGMVVYVCNLLNRQK